jgi:hypothetical protein
METLTPEAVSVIDLFLGSGSSMIAAESRRMACFGAELSPAYAAGRIRARPQSSAVGFDDRTQIDSPSPNPPGLVV